MEIITDTAIFDTGAEKRTTVRVAAEDSGVSFSLHRGGLEPIEKFQIKGYPVELSEMLQFVADTVSKKAHKRMSPFVRGWIGTATEAHDIAKRKGFWEQGAKRNDSEMIMLTVTELAEAVEALRRGNPPDEKLPDFTQVETELADAVIRIMDQAQARGWRVAQAVEAKLRYNATRGYKHGKEF